MTPLHGKCQIYKQHFTFFIFANVRPVRSKVTESHIETDRLTHTYTYIATGEILRLA